MNDRERFIACILGQPLDRPPYWLFWGPWGSTWRRWEREGKPARIAPAIEKGRYIHKTSKSTFRIVFWAIVLAQVVLITFALLRR